MGESPRALRVDRSCMAYMRTSHHEPGKTGVVLDPVQIGPPAWRRDTTWRSRGKRRLQHEVVVFAQVEADQPAIVDGGRSPAEIEDYVTAR